MSQFDDLFESEEKTEEIPKEEMKTEEVEVVEVKKGRIPKRGIPKGRKPQLYVLTEENVLIFIKQTNRTKKYEMKHRFYNASALEINNMVEKLIKENKLKKFKHGWIGISTNN